MRKEDWLEAYREFDKAHSELVEYAREYEYGSNKKIREKAERNMQHVKHTIEYLFRKFPEVYEMAAGGGETSDYGRTITMDEFFQNRYIVGDLGKLLLSIKEKIEL